MAYQKKMQTEKTKEKRVWSLNRDGFLCFGFAAPGEEHLTIERAREIAKEKNLDIPSLHVGS